MEDSDIQISINNVRLKVRVVCIVKTLRGFLFEKSDYDYVFVVGGKVSINETLGEAVKREMKEEIGMDVKDADLCAILENLYGSDPKKVHEISFVYRIGDVFTGPIPKGFLEIPSEDLEKVDIRPRAIAGLLKNEKNQLQYIIVNEWKM